MTKILALDMGCNSLGFNYIDTAKQEILCLGSHVFPSGIDGKTENQNRRECRLQRRNHHRRNNRVKKLKTILNSYGITKLNTGSTDILKLRCESINKQISLDELASVLIALCKKRGFKSSRKNIKKEDDGDFKKNIKQTKELIESNNYKTVGETLFKIKDTSIIKRKVSREMILNEVDQILSFQKTYYSNILNNKFIEDVKDVISFQRKMYWNKNTIGKCEFEKNEIRCPKSHRLFEQYRIINDIHNLRVIEDDKIKRILSLEEQNTIYKQLMTTKQVNFNSLKKLINLPEYQYFNFEDADREHLNGATFDIEMNKITENKWDNLHEDIKNNICDLILDDSKEEDEIIKKCTEDFNIDINIATSIVKLINPFPSGYSSISQLAIKKVLPYLKNGKQLDSKENSALVSAGYTPRYSEIHKPMDFLPFPKDISNPKVKSCMIQSKRVINQIVKKFGKPDRFIIELAREIHKPEIEKKEIRDRQKENKKIRDECIREIEKFRKEPKEKQILRMRLWKEQNGRCVYSGDSINQLDVFSEEYEVDHILPYCKSLDDSDINKCLVKHNENHEKNNQTGYQWLYFSNPDKYNQIISRFSQINKEKLRRFQEKDIILKDFINRQLSDTKYASKLLKEYVEIIANKKSDVIVTRGQLTSQMRKSLGLNNILDTSYLQSKKTNDKNNEPKCRDDHRHHAIDAAVIAVFDESVLKRLAASRNNCVLKQMEPWPGYCEQIKEKIKSVVPSVWSPSKIRGRFHEETVYGATQKLSNPEDMTDRPWTKGWTEDKNIFTIRKPIRCINSKNIDDIRDKTQKEIIKQTLKERNISLENSSDKEFEAAILSKPITMKSGCPIKNVTLIKKEKSVIPIRTKKSIAYVKPGTIHHVTIFKDKDEYLCECVTMLEAVQRKNNKMEVVQKVHKNNKNAKFMIYLKKGDIVSGEVNNKRNVFVFRSTVSTVEKGRYEFSYVCDAHSKRSDQKKILFSSKDLFNKFKIKKIQNKLV